MLARFICSRQNTLQEKDTAREETGKERKRGKGKGERQKRQRNKNGEVAKKFGIGSTYFNNYGEIYLKPLPVFNLSVHKIYLKSALKNMFINRRTSTRT